MYVRLQVWMLYNLIDGWTFTTRCGVALTADNKVLMTTFDTLASVDGATGKVDWSYQTMPTARSSVELCHPVIHPVSGDIYVPDSRSAKVYCFSRAGALKWKTTLAGESNNNYNRAQTVDYRPALTLDGDLLFMGVRWHSRH